MFTIAMALLALLEPAQAGPPTPCPVISRPTDRPTEWRDFASLTTIGMFHVRVLEGKTNCIFHALDAGRCTLSDPKVIVAIDSKGQETWYGIPAGQPVNIEVRDGGYSCMVGRIVRTD
ncbi:MAG: hypothetical protein ACXWHD_12470 [Candidatus Aminicenantales bacterium]